MSLLAAFRRPGILLLLPLLLALAARVLVAPGWMIESDAGGSITVRICSDPANPGGTMTIPLEKAGDHKAGEAQQHCPWGALANAPIVPICRCLPWRPSPSIPVPRSGPLARLCAGHRLAAATEYRTAHLRLIQTQPAARAFAQCGP